MKRTCKKALYGLAAISATAFFSCTELAIEETVIPEEPVVEEHIEEDLSLDKLADEFFISKYHIAHIFKENLGMSIHQYITKKILQPHTVLWFLNSYHIYYLHVAKSPPGYPHWW